jgi:hypothetical protein
MRVLCLGLLCGVTVLPQLAEAACTCDQTIAVYNGPAYQMTDASAVPAGGTLCITAGARNAAMVINNVHGSLGHPVTIQNCGGLVDVNATNGAGLQISGSFFRLTGTGDATLDKGIRIASTASGDNALQIVGLSTDFELDHLEIAGASYAGIMAKVDPAANCDPAFTRPTATFVMQNVHIHDLDVHDTMTGEGMYLGDSFYNGTDVYNDGSAACPVGKLQYPPELRHVQVHDNHVHNTGREAIQVGCGVEDIDVHDNQVELYGQTNLASQNGGIQIGVGTTGSLHHNTLIGGTGEAIVIQGIGDNLVYDNVVVGAGGVAMSVNVRPTPLTTDVVNQGFLGGVYFIHNTLIDSGNHGAIIEYINMAPNNLFEDNFIVSAAASWNQLYAYTSWSVTHNVAVQTLAAAGFVNGAGNDYALTASSPAVGQGVDSSPNGVTADFIGTSFASPPSVGAYEIVLAVVDGGRPDAGAPDSGSSFVDAGRADAGVDDAGALDAGEVDAGEVDAGALDAGALDASMPMADGGGETTPARGCGCNTGVDLQGLVLAALLLRNKRRRAP